MMTTSLTETKAQNVTLVTKYHNKVLKNKMKEIIKNTKCFFTYLTLFHSSFQAFYFSDELGPLFFPKPTTVPSKKTKAKSDNHQNQALTINSHYLTNTELAHCFSSTRARACVCVFFNY